MGFRVNSIRLKLQFIVLITTFVALTFSLIGNVVGDIWEFHRNAISTANAGADRLGRLVMPMFVSGQPTSSIYLQTAMPGMHAVAVYGGDGKLLASYIKPRHTAVIPPFAGPAGSTVVEKELAVFRPLPADIPGNGTIYLLLRYDLTNTIIEDIEIAAVVTALALAIAMLMIAKLEKMVTLPIAAASDMARRVVEQRDYSRRAQKYDDDEVGVLVDSLNQMLDVIEQRNTELEASYRNVEQLNTGLEQRVRDRTAELEATNGALLVAKASAEEANQAKSAFLSSMSHELRTPLNAILGFAQLLESDPAQPEQGKEFTGYILNSGRHLLALINEILNLAHVESGTVALELEPVPLGPMLQECQTMTEPLAGRRGVRLRLPQHVPYMLHADRTRLRQVLLNLLSNAVKYNRPDGLVTVTCSEVEQRQIRIVVQDEGKGLTPQQVAALFQPFNRLGQEMGQEEGTGIGLVVTKRLVELMNGRIGVDSTPGAGSTFWIELPSLSSQHAAAPNADAGGAEAGTLDAPISTLLYVEDNLANMRLMEEIIRLNPSLHLIPANDAIMGIQLARAHLPDLILLDIQLPGMDGYDALKILQADPLTAPIPVIALTASAMHSDVAEGEKSGFFRYLTKPLDLEQFGEALNSALALRHKQAQIPIPESI